MPAGDGTGIWSAAQEEELGGVGAGKGLEVGYVFGGEGHTDGEEGFGGGGYTDGAEGFGGGGDTDGAEVFCGGGYTDGAEGFGGGGEG